MLKKWQKKEIKDAKDFGGTLQPHSGSGWNSPSDVLSNRFSVDSKWTSRSSYSISLTTWNKLCEEAAWNAERMPLLSLDISGTELVVVSKEDFLKLIETP
jgi:hypothetical protein